MNLCANAALMYDILNSAQNCIDQMMDMVLSSNWIVMFHIITAKYKGRIKSESRWEVDF